MRKFKYWLLSIVGMLCGAISVSAQTITVLTTDGNSKTITNVDSIQFCDNNALNLTILKADNASIKFQVNVPAGKRWTYALIPSATYALLKAEKGYTDAHFLTNGVHLEGTQIVEINDGDATPRTTDYWTDKYSIKPGTSFCLLVAEAHKTYSWNGTINWYPQYSEDVVNGYNPTDTPQSSDPFEDAIIPDYNKNIRLGKYLTKSTDENIVFHDFFYQQFFWTTAPLVASETPIVNVNKIAHEALHFNVTPPSAAESCKMLLLTDDNYTTLIKAVGEEGLQAHVLANGETVEGSTEFNIDTLLVGTKYHILVAAAFDAQGNTQSFTHQEASTLSVNDLPADGNMPIILDDYGLTNAYAEVVNVGDARNDSIDDPFNIPYFTRVKSHVAKAFSFKAHFPSLPAGTYKVSAIIVPTAYHKELEKELVNNKGVPYVEQVKFTPRIYTGKNTLLAQSNKIEAPSDRVEKVVLFENLNIADEETSSSSEATYTIEFSVGSLDRGTAANPKCEAINVYQLIIEPCESPAARK